MANLGPVILVGAAIALFAASRKKKTEAVPEPSVDPEGGDTLEPVVVEDGMYYGQNGTAKWMIFEEPDGMYTWVWRLKTSGPESTWPVHGGGPVPSHQAAQDGLTDALETNLGPEGVPGVDELIEEPPSPEPEPGGFDPHDPGQSPPEGPGEFGQ